MKVIFATAKADKVLYILKEENKTVEGNTLTRRKSQNGVKREEN